MEDIRKRISFIQSFLIGATALNVGISLAIHADIASNHADAMRWRQSVETRLDRNQEAILNFTTRTVDRWNALQQNNPQLSVPNVQEPISSPHLTPEELKRP